MTQTGMIFNIQKFSIRDGTGIRTLVFMKGCPLRCLWCSNPESQHREPEIMEVKSNCIQCGKCANICPQGAVSKKDFTIDRHRCNQCGLCAEHCYAQAKKFVGMEMELQDLLEKIDRDRVFYLNSGGGVTVGGGEPMMQATFVAELLQHCRRLHIHTAIETSAYCPQEDARNVFQQVDQIFFDLKHMDSKQHRHLTGVGNEQILANARIAAELSKEEEKELIFRIPLIPGRNDSRENLLATGKFVDSLQCGGNPRIQVELLPYHDFGRMKYEQLGRIYPLPEVGKPSEEQIEVCRNAVRTCGCRVT